MRISSVYSQSSSRFNPNKLYKPNSTSSIILPSTYIRLRFPFAFLNEKSGFNKEYIIAKKKLTNLPLCDQYEFLKIVSEELNINSCSYTPSLSMII